MVVSEDQVTVKEAAQLLGTTKEKVARLVRQGVLTSRPSVLDARRRLIPLAELERILEAEGRHVSVQGGSRSENRARPRTAGMYTGLLDVHSDEVEDYLRQHWLDR